MDKSSPILSTGGLSTILITLIQKCVKDTNLANVLTMFAPIISAIIIYFVFRFISKFIKPIPMLKIQHSYKRQLKEITTALNNSNLDQQTKDTLNKQYSEVLLESLEVEKSFRNGKFVINTTSNEN